MSVQVRSRQQKINPTYCIPLNRQGITLLAGKSISYVQSTKLRRSIQFKPKLDSRSVLLVQDWATKYMPRKYREAQSDWFAKRGLPWHISVAIRRSEDSEHFESQTLVHVFQSCAQNSVTVASIMLDCLATLKKEIPELETLSSICRECKCDERCGYSASDCIFRS